MGKKETIYPIETLGGKIQKIRLELDMDRIDFHNFLFPEEKGIKPESKLKNIQNIESGAVNPPIDKLITICKKCNVSSDYLLGIMKEVTHDNHFICEETGLTEKSVEVLKKINQYGLEIHKRNTQVINVILEDLETTYKNYPYTRKLNEEESKKLDEWREEGDLGYEEYVLKKYENVILDSKNKTKRYGLPGTSTILLELHKYIFINHYDMYIKSIEFGWGSEEANDVMGEYFLPGSALESYQIWRNVAMDCFCDGIKRISKEYENRFNFEED